MKPIVVFDVESVGLHGEGFAVGVVVVDIETGETLQEYLAACPAEVVDGESIDLEWVKQNVDVLSEVEGYPYRIQMYSQPSHVRYEFWSLWREWAERDALLLADCNWPVEANFLTACVDDQPDERKWQGPYPLLDLAPILWAQGKDPTATFDRLQGEQPAHNPLNDARQSARVLLEALR